MKIVQLISENIKCLKAVSIAPKGDVVVISGKNGQGKSSTLDSIEYALAGRDSVCEEPVRKGQQKARIVCDLGDLVVERTFSAVSGESQLRVKTKDGKPVKSPQAMLDELCCHVAFDPLSFVRMKAADQLETLQKLVGLDFTELNAKRKQAYTDRELKGRELRAAQGKLAAIPFHTEAPAAEVDISKAQERLTAIRRQRAENQKVRQAVGMSRLEIQSLGQHISGLQSRIAQLEAELADCRTKLAIKVTSLEAEKVNLAAAEQAAAALVEDNETEVLTEIANAQAINDQVRHNREHQAQNAEVQRLQFDYDALTHTIEDIDQLKRDQLEWAQFPLEGLSFDDARVLLDGVPFQQASQAQQLRAAVAIGLALNPKVRVVLIRDGSLLDDDSMAMISELAARENCQIWIERVGDAGKAAIVIEDGEIKE